MQKTFSPLLQISLCTFGYLYATTDISLAQVTPDGTVNTQVNQNGNVAEITGGETRGSNLFHSFQDFSVSTGNEAFFNNATNVSNIFSRVTGGRASDIDGTIRANGNASLFLINPAGIMFGENARLDIGGSFLGTTADSILFEDGEFSAADLDNPPLLTVNAPIGLNFRDNPEPINIERQPPGSADFNPAPSFDDNLFGLRVPDGKTFGLAGGDITADGGGIVAVGGRVELGAVGESGTLGINFEGDNINFDFPDDLARANVSLINNAGFLVSGSGGGDIAITANNIDILEGSGLFAGIFSGLGSANAQAGDITLQANESVTVDGVTEDGDVSGIFNQVDSDAIGNSGTLNIDTANLSVTNGAQIGSSTFGLGDGGTILINASESVVLEEGDNNNFTSIYSNVESSGIGNSGGVNIIAELLEVNQGGQIQSIVFGGEGNSGKIIIDSNTVSLDGRNVNDSPSGAFSLTTEGGVGNAGGLEITANSFSMTNRAQILSNTAGMGNAGNVDIFVEDEVNLVNSSILAEVTEGTGMGEGGDINIETTSLLLQEGSALLTDTENIGNGGNINIEASDRVILEGEGLGAFANSTDIVPSQITATVDDFEGVIGDGGDINISTPSLTVKDNGFIRNRTFEEGNAGNLTIDVQNLTVIQGGRIDASTFGEGNAGNLTITASEIQISGSDGNFPTAIFASALNGNGDAGNLTITTDKLIMRDEAVIDVGNFPTAFSGETLPEPGTGAAGSLTIEANSIEVNNGIISAANANGVGGELEVNANSLTLENGASILAETTANTGTGGVINLNIDGTLQMRDNSLISSQATEGATGGNIDINTEFIVAFPNQIAGNGSDIIASAVEGDGGNINITAESLLGIKEGMAIEGNQTNDIDASSEFSLDGSITINTPDINPIQGATELPTNIVVPEETVAQACRANREIAAKNGLNITGKGGIPAEPGIPLNSQNIAINGSTNPTSTIPAPIETAQGKIQPARGIKFTESGEIILTAYRTNNSGERLPEIKPNCS
ncbi:filamentous hemagglutinin N-terminal domain-containing protein [Pleurocapsa sp. PCC 7319]|uniref:two-partner secretion domain-containing protein n=1 Tax=Pleurocapsa sp. PCC 7319 TaxID=118161 RepID=UPI00034B06C3|nr:filamentous hemagglutinin N-terminal domain-containing protein [Pleurocapsa sp. PCC 7319]